jgi:hypothetical protein
MVDISSRTRVPTGFVRAYVPSILWVGVGVGPGSGSGPKGLHAVSRTKIDTIEIKSKFFFIKNTPLLLKTLLFD